MHSRQGELMSGAERPLGERGVRLGRRSPGGAGAPACPAPSSPEAGARSRVHPPRLRLRAPASGEDGAVLTFPQVTPPPLSRGGRAGRNAGEEPSRLHHVPLWLRRLGSAPLRPCLRGGGAQGGGRRPLPADVGGEEPSWVRHVRVSSPLAPAARTLSGWS